MPTNVIHILEVKLPQCFKDMKKSERMYTVLESSLSTQFNIYLDVGPSLTFSSG